MLYRILLFLFLISNHICIAQKTSNPTIRILLDSTEYYKKTEHNAVKMYKYAERALQQAKRQNKPDSVALSLYEVMGTLISLTQPEAAIDSFYKNEKFILHAQPKYKAYAYVELANAYNEIGDFYTANEFMEKSIDILTQAGLYKDANETKVDWLDILITIKELRKVIKEGYYLINYFKQTKRYYWLPYIYTSIGEAYIQIEMPDSALACFLKGYETSKKYAQEVNRPYLTVLLLKYIQQTHLKLKNFNKVKIYLDAGFDFFNKNKTKFDTRDSLIATSLLSEFAAIYYKEKKDIEKSRFFLFQGLEAEKILGSDYNIAVAYENIAKFYLSIEDFPKVLTYCDSTLLYSKQIEDYEFEVTVRALRVETFLKLYRYGDALTEKNLLYNRLTRAKIKGAKAHAYGTIAMFDSTVGNFESAYRYRKMAEALQDSFYNENLISSASKIETRFALENEFAEQRRIKALKQAKANALQLAENERQSFGIGTGLGLLFLVGFYLRKRTLPTTIVNTNLHIEKIGAILVLGTLFILYEFILLILSPTISDLTDDVPLYKFACNIVIVLLLSPLFNIFKNKLNLQTDKI